VQDIGRLVSASVGTRGRWWTRGSGALRQSVAPALGIVEWVVMHPQLGAAGAVSDYGRICE
jgi:hypothetical protein